MVGWHDSRRQLFLESLTLNPGIHVQSDGINDVLLSTGLVNARPGVETREVEHQLREFAPRHVAGQQFALDIGGDAAAYHDIVREHAEVIRPNYVCIAQQRVQPGNDPEHSTPLPSIPTGTGLGRGVKVAVVDTGVADQTGARDVWTGAEGRAFGPADFDPLYDPRTPARRPLLAWAAGHGTFVGSLVRQIAPDAAVVPIRACSPMGYESEDQVADGIDRAIDTGADIISLSWCAYALVDQPATPGQAASYFEPVRLRQSIDRAIDRGIVVVAAAGNSASPDPMYPAAWPDVLAVGALDRDGNRWEHSNYGLWVDAWALGHKVRGVYVRGRENPANDPDGHAENWDNPRINYATWSGTSFATPLVAGQLAILASALGGSAEAARRTLLAMSRSAPDDPAGKRIVIDLPGQT